MNGTQKIIYGIWPFVAAGIAKLIFKDEQSYEFFLGLCCIASFFLYAKIILPNQEKKYNAIFDIDPESTYNEKRKDKTVYIAWFHLLVLMVLIVMFVKDL